MKIYFEDGILRSHHLQEKEVNWRIYADYGYSHCIKQLDMLLETVPDSIVYTNFLPALSGKYAWNKEEGQHDIYLRNADGEFVRIQNLTNRELREGHDIMKMYMNGEFKHKEEEK